MNTLLLRRLALLSLVTFPLASAGSAKSGTPDRAADLLVRRGTVAVSSVGEHVEIGTYRIQVAAKLGHPHERLPDGSWLYHGRRIVGSAAAGTLVIRFEAGRVSSLTLATPAAIAALRANPALASDQALASKQ